MAGFFHKVLFGGSGSGVAAELDATYGGDAVYVSSSNEEQSTIIIASESGWGPNQTFVMSNAVINGKVDWWHRITHRDQGDIT